MSPDVALDVAALRRDFPVLEREFHSRWAQDVLRGASPMEAG